MSVLLATLIVGAGTGVGIAAGLAAYAQKNWARRTGNTHAVASPTTA
ncbi:MAG: hypothetical protein ABW212_17885 [Pseudonocardia sediminis]